MEVDGSRQRARPKKNSVKDMKRIIVVYLFQQDRHMEKESQVHLKIGRYC